MQSLFSKVFGRKKDDKAVSPPTGATSQLLGGKFEAISPNVSPQPPFAELQDPSSANGNDKAKDPAFGVFRTKSRSAPSESRPKKTDALPHLSLNFFNPNGASSSGASGTLFDSDQDIQLLLSDAVIGRRRLNPFEALVLVQACSQLITERGPYFLFFFLNRG